MVRICSFFLLQFFFLSASQGQYSTGGTSCIAYINSDTIWMAADSKMGMTGPKNQRYFFKVDKIGIGGNIFFTISGHLRDLYDKDSTLVYSAPQIILANIYKYDYLDSAITRIANAIIARLTFLYSHSIPSFQKFMVSEPNIILLDICLASNNPSRFGISRLIISYNSDKTFTGFFALYYPVVTAQDGTYLTGLTSEMEKRLKGISIRHYPGNNMLERLTALIALEEKANPTKVGGPVDIIKIFRGGFQIFQDIPIK